MNIYKTLKKRFLKAAGTAVQNFIPEFSQIAELLTGGIVIFSEHGQNGDRKIFAQTVLQLDGDVITAFTKIESETPILRNYHNNILKK